MANPLDNIVNVSIDFQAASTSTAKGFGIPLILSYKDGSFAGDTLEITSASDLLDVANGYSSLDAEYLMAKAIFAQNPRPEKVIIGKTTGYDPKYTVKLTPLNSPVAITAATTYTMSFANGDGNTQTVTTPAVSGTGTVNEAATMIANQFDAHYSSADISAFPAVGEILDIKIGTGSTITTTFTAAASTLDGTIAEINDSISGNGAIAVKVGTARIMILPKTAFTDVEIEATSTAAVLTNLKLSVGKKKGLLNVSQYFDVKDNTGSVLFTAREVSYVLGIDKKDTDFSMIEETPAAPVYPASGNLQEIFQDIRSENDDWYAAILPYGGKLVVNNAEMGTVITDGEKILLFNLVDDEVLKNDPDTNIAKELFDASGKKRWIPFYHRFQHEMPHAAWAGKVLPQDPGSVTWMFKELSGVTFYPYLPVQILKLKENNVNMYLRISGRSFVQNGTTSDDTFYVDSVRSIDFIKSRMQEAIFTQLTTLKKIPFTNAGASIIENEVRSVLQLGISLGMISSDPAPTVSVPDVNDTTKVTPTDKSSRTLPNVNFTATLAGAIHKVIIKGVVSV